MKTLFDRTSMSNKEIKNRFIRSATWENMADERGHITERLLNLYEDLAKGGIGMIITSLAYITEDSKSVKGQIGIYDDTFIGEYNKLVNAVHKYNSPIILQITYGFKNGQTLDPNEVTVENLKEIITAMGIAAERAEKAGFDGVQIYAAHGAFLSNFLSPSKNKRTDEYGGNAENKYRIIIEIFEEIKRKTGKDFIVLSKLNCVDADDFDMTFEICKAACVKLDEKGINGIELSGDPDGFSSIGIGKYPESVFRDYAAQIAEAVNIPIVLVGRNRSPVIMEKILNETKIQYFSLARPLLRQSDLVNTWEKDLNQASKCISCNKCFLDRDGGNVCIYNK